ncbi:hypothetical protein CPAR01_02570 [Colletotrichum paranaense]|uniref:Clr5 domain-containing protein n=1 Tax=Colletotrichum paranaense TaxID=1914294 RepID=A0ABQ9SZW9_9PEZI|nr:uncharacterized protein CPAR01_02570 [Colletotrichum paranaense]KAK1545068.1 hypothetical protein CPAR01_02570 [Colletotrichum paranaense]
MASSRKRYSDEEWLQHRAEIQRMFLNESASFNEIIRKLEEDGFPVTKSQLEYKLKVWGLRRRISKNDAKIFWHFVDDHLAKREQQGKLSQVIRDGKVIEPAKVRKERSRYQRTSLEKFQAGSATPQAPPGFNITICTPATSNMKFVWPRSLPWLEFQTMFPELPRAHGAYMRTGLGSELPRFPANLDILKSLHLPISSDRSSVARLTAQLASTMPEGQEGNNARLAQALLQAPTQLTTSEHLKLLIYRISNSMKVFEISDDLSCWARTLVMLEDSGIMSLKFSVGKTVGPTLSAFTEKLFQRAFLIMFYMMTYGDLPGFLFELDSDCSDFEIDCTLKDRLEPLRARTKKVVLWLLSLGQSPDVYIDLPDLTSDTPLGLAITINEPHLALQLLDAGADPHFSYTGLSEALYGQWMQFPEFDHEGKMAAVFKRFADCGLSLSEDRNGNSALMLAVKYSNRTAADMLIQFGANVLWSCQYGRFSYSPSIREASVLGSAAGLMDETRAMEFIKLLTAHAHSTYPSTPTSQFFKLDVVMNASKNGHVSVLEYLHQIGYDTAGAEYEGFTALHIAAFAGRYRACKWLLDHGSLVDGPNLSNGAPPPIIFAALKGDEDVVRLLHEAGADLNTSLSFEANANSWMDTDWISEGSLRRDSRIVCQLGGNTINPAGAAILNPSRDKKVCTYLAKHGARLPGWAAYYGAYANDIDLVKVAVAEYSQVNINWLDQNKEKLLQTLLSLALRDEDLRHQPWMQKQVVDLCFEVLSAGPVMMGGEAQLAMFLDSWDLVEAILQRGSAGSVQKNNGMSLLEAAFLSGSDSIIQHVFERIPEAYDGSALCAAVLLASNRKCMKFLQRLLQNRQNWDCPSLLEGTAIGLAVFNGEMQALRILCGQIGTPPAAISSVGGVEHTLFQWTKRLRDLPFWHDKHTEVTEPLSFIVESSWLKAKLRELGYRSWEHLIQVTLNIDSEETLEIRLFSSESDIRPEQQKDKSMLFLVTRDGRLKSVEIEDFHQKTYMICGRGRSPLQQAVEDGDLTKIDLLLGAGADINAPAADQAGATALQLAAITGRIGIAKMLIDMGADVDAPRAPESGRTALEGAAEHGRIDMIQLLLSEGAETGGKGRLQYMRAIKFAERQGHLVAANMLREYRDWTVDDDDLWSELED